MEKKRFKKEKFVEIMFKAVVFTVLALWSIAMLYMLVWGLLTSLKSDTDFSTFMNYLGIPDRKWSKSEILFGNYKLIFENFTLNKSTIFYMGNTLVTHRTKSNFLTMCFNTIVYALGSACLTAIVCYLVSYLCCKYKFKFSKFLYAYVVFMMATPILGGESSMISLTRSLGIYDTYFCFLLQKSTFGGMYFLVFYAFFEGLPDAYMEAAEIDGASQWRVLWNIIIPLGIKMISTVVLINFVAYWNDYQAPILYTPTLPTLAVGVFELCNGSGTAQLKNTPTLVSACMILVIPVALMFVCFNKKLMGNMTMGGLKG